MLVKEKAAVTKQNSKREKVMSLNDDELENLLKLREMQKQMEEKKF